MSSLRNIKAKMIMKKEINSSIVIKASPQEIWKTLVDLESYPDWNPFIVYAKGRIAKNEKINITTKPVGRNSFSFTPTINEVVRNKKIIWLGKAIVRGLFDGQHLFELHDNQDETTTFTQKESFSGLLIPFCKKMIEVDTLKGFILMNEALKKKVEEGK